MIDARTHNAIVTFAEEWFDANFDWGHPDRDDGRYGIAEREGLLAAMVRFRDVASAEDVANAVEDCLHQIGDELVYLNAILSEEDMIAVTKGCVAIAVEEVRRTDPQFIFDADHYSAAATLTVRRCGWEDANGDWAFPRRVMRAAMRRVARNRTAAP